MIDQLINILVISSWQILILSLIVWPLSRLSIRAYPNFAYILWVVILVKALIPINITLPSQQIPVVSISPVITGEFLPVIPAAPSSQFSINMLIGLIWMIGVIFLAGKLVQRELTHRKKMRSAELLAPEAWFEDMKAELGIKQHIHLYMNENIQSPLMQGLWNVKIYLPPQYQSWTLAEKQSVLAHELTHIRRLDIIIIYLQAVVKTLYFFHPVIWLVNDQIDLEREKICDDAAIHVSRADRGTYGDQLFRQLSSESGKKSVPVLAGGFFMSDNSIIKRFRYIKEKRGDMQGKLKFYHIMLILVVISLAMIIACSQEIDSNAITSTSVNKNIDERFVINGLIYDKANPKPFAIINGDIYGEGYEIKGYTINSITDSLIILMKGEETIRLDIQRAEEPESASIDTSNFISVTYDHPPQPVGGYAAIRKNVHYPELLRKAGIGGTTIVQVQINEQGKPLKGIVLKSAGDKALDAAAIKAVISAEWMPAEMDGSPVAVQIALPIVFRLKTGDSDHSITTANTAGSIDLDKSPRPEDWKAISQNIIYPDEARKDGVTGTLTMQFTVSEKGNLLSFKVINGPDHEALRAAAIHALKATKWIPGEKDGKPIAAIMEMGIGFGTEEEQNKTQKKADGLRPLDRIGNVPVTIKGPGGAEKAKDVSFKIYINSDGLFEGIGGSISSTDEDVIVDQEAMQKWMESKWVPMPKEAKLEAQWIQVPLEFTFID